MGPIQPVNIGGGAAASPLQDGGTIQRQPAIRGAGEQGGAIGAVSQPNDMLSELGSLLGQIQDSESNRMLQMLMVMIVLLALLGEGQQQTSSGGDDALSQLSQQGSFYSQSISYTSLSIEQTTIQQTAYMPPSQSGGLDVVA